MTVIGPQVEAKSSLQRLRLRRYRCQILKVLQRSFANNLGLTAWMDFHDLPCWGRGETSHKADLKRQLCAAAVNRLLQEGLVLGDFHGTPKLRLNPMMASKIRDECALDWRFWAGLVVALAAAVAAILAIPGVPQFLHFR
jgi:hypothetical protein